MSEVTGIRKNLLNMLSATYGLEQKDLALRLNLKLNTLSYYIQELEKRNLLHRVRVRRGKTQVFLVFAGPDLGPHFEPEVEPEVQKSKSIEVQKSLPKSTILDTLDQKVQVLEKKIFEPELHEIVQELVSYIIKYKVPAFNVGKKTFRTTQIEKIVAIMKEKYIITRK